jgi:hypothetical protein
MTHHHDHDHDHSHSHSGETGTLSFEEKMEKLLNHWIQHNSDHAATYREWAGRAEEAGNGPLAEKLQEAAQATLSINERFESAAKLVRKP